MSEMALMSNELAGAKKKLAAVENEMQALKAEIDALKKALEEKTTALTNQEELSNQVLASKEAIEKELDSVRKDAEALAMEAKKIDTKLTDKDDELAKAVTSLAAAEGEAKNWMSLHEELKESSDKEIDDLKRKLAESDSKLQKLQTDYDSIKFKFDSIIKGGENLDNVTKAYYASLENELTEAKQSIEKFRYKVVN